MAFELRPRREEVVGSSKVIRRGSRLRVTFSGLGEVEDVVVGWIRGPDMRLRHELDLDMADLRGFYLTPLNPPTRIGRHFTIVLGHDRVDVLPGMNHSRTVFGVDTPPRGDSALPMLLVRLLPKGQSAWAFEGVGDVAQWDRDHRSAVIWRLILSLDWGPWDRRCYSFPVAGGRGWSVVRGEGNVVRVTPSVRFAPDFHAMVVVTDAVHAPPELVDT